MLSSVFRVEKPKTEIVEFHSIERTQDGSGRDKLRCFIVESPHANIRRVGLFDLFSDMRGMWRLIDHLAERGMRTVGDLDRKTTSEIFAGENVSLAKRIAFFDRLKSSRSGQLTDDYLLPPR